MIAYPHYTNVSNVFLLFKLTLSGTIYAAIKMRHAQGLFPDERVLSVDELELRACKMLDKGMPVFVYICKAQHINVIKDRAGKVVEGGEDNIVACYYAFAMQQQLNDETSSMEWKIQEFQIVGLEPIY